MLNNDFNSWNAFEKQRFKTDIKNILNAKNNNREARFGKDYREWDFKKLQDFYDTFNLGEFEEYVFYFKNIDLLELHKKATTNIYSYIDNEWIEKLNAFLNCFGLKKIIELLKAENDKKTYFYENCVIKTLTKSKANKKDVILMFFNGKYFNELSKYIRNIYQEDKKIFEEAFNYVDNKELFVEKCLLGTYFKEEIKDLLEKHNFVDFYWKNTKIDRVLKEDLKTYIDNYKKYENPYLWNLCINECQDINDLEIILETLKKMKDHINQKYSNKKNISNNNIQMDSYYIDIMLNKIYENSEFYETHFDDLLSIELTLYPFISSGENNYKTPKTLEMQFIKDPNYLLELLSFCYLPDGITEEEKEKIKEENKNKDFSRIFNILYHLNFLPDMNWCEKIIYLHTNKNYKFNKNIIYNYIGQLLSNSPIDKDDEIYPNKQTRDIVEKYFLEANNIKSNRNTLLSSFSCSKFNSGGFVNWNSGKNEKGLN